MSNAVPLDARVGIVGAGTMGAGIAQVAATAGHQVLVYDVRPGAADDALDAVAGALARLVGKRRVSQPDAEAIRARMHTVELLEELLDCALVVEAIAEDLGAKRQLFTDLERSCRPDTLLVTNTSTISVTDIAALLAHPGRVCGMHFFNPAPVMRLVEVPAGEATEPHVAERVAATAEQWGKTAVRCASTPGFIVNRVARPFYGEAQRMLAEGVGDCASIDVALRAAGFRLGPFELADLIGNDVNLASTESVWQQTGHDPRYEPTAAQQSLVAAGRLGRKSGAGWYDYADGEPVRPADPAGGSRATQVGADNDAIAVRVIALLVDEAAALVDRGEASAEDVDIAMRLGTNYPYGPLEWGDQLGAQRLVDTLEEPAAEHPTGRYGVSERLANAARSGQSLRV